MRRVLVDEAETVNDWIWRECGWRGRLGEVLADPRSVCLSEGEGGAVFIWRGPGIYETHCFFEQRGKEVRDISRRFLAHMRDEFGARLIWAAIPDDTPKVKVFVRWLGFKSIGHDLFPQGPCELFQLEF